jgi:hypothetical protein
VRLSFVDHGADLSKEGAQSLADKVNSANIQTMIDKHADANATLCTDEAN